MKNKKKSINIYLDEETFDLLDKHAKTQMRTRSGQALLYIMQGLATDGVIDLQEHIMSITGDEDEPDSANLND